MTTSGSDGSRCGCRLRVVHTIAYLPARGTRSHSLNCGMCHRANSSARSVWREHQPPLLSLCIVLLAYTMIVANWCSSRCSHSDGVGAFCTCSSSHVPSVSCGIQDEAETSDIVRRVACGLLNDVVCCECYVCAASFNGVVRGCNTSLACVGVRAEWERIGVEGESGCVLRVAPLQPNTPHRCWHAATHHTTTPHHHITYCHHALPVCHQTARCTRTTNSQLTRDTLTSTSLAFSAPHCAPLASLTPRHSSYHFAAPSTPPFVRVMSQ